MYLIAEIGFNHEGKMDVARDLIHAAAEAGADAVKFQTFRAGDIALPSSPHYDLIKQGELTHENHVDLFETAQKAGLDFLSTPFSLGSVDLLQKIGVSAFKVASMDCTNLPLLKHIAATGKPVYLSTGMAELHEIALSLNRLKAWSKGEVILLHCLSLYPAGAKDLNLDVIPFLRSLFNVPVGYSDHYPGTDACFAAAAMGAQVIETHFTLDKSIPGGDHGHSADPHDIKKLKEKLVLFEQMKGSKEAVYFRPDKKCALDFRRGVYAGRDLVEGNQIQADDLVCSRPPSDFTPNDIRELVGRTLKESVSAFNPITRETVD